MSVDEEASRAQSGPDVLRILLNDDRLRFLELRTVGEGIGAVFVEAEMALHAIALVGRRGWICTLHDRNRIAIEPGTPTAVLVPPHLKLYHVGDSDKGHLIRQQGLVPGSGGNTSLGRTYSGRLHLALRKRDAFQFVHHQITRPSRAVDGTSRCRRFDELDLYLVDTAPGYDMFNDDHFDGRGVWTNAPIPASSIRLVDPTEWHPLYRAMYPDDFDEANFDHLISNDGW